MMKETVKSALERSNVNTASNTINNQAMVNSSTNVKETTDPEVSFKVPVIPSQGYLRAASPRPFSLGKSTWGSLDLVDRHSVGSEEQENVAGSVNRDRSNSMDSGMSFRSVDSVAKPL